MEVFYSVEVEVGPLVGSHNSLGPLTIRYKTTHRPGVTDLYMIIIVVVIIIIIMIMLFRCVSPIPK